MDSKGAPSRPIIEKTSRVVAIAVAWLFIGLSLGGIFGVWFAARSATDAVRKGFGLVETGVGVVEAGVARVHDLIASSRTEVRQAVGTITTVGARAEANSPVLNALNERLETRLVPRVAQLQQALAPVREALGTIRQTVSLMNSLPGMADRAPRLAALDATFDRLESLSADTTQLRSTLRALVLERNGDAAAETVATIEEITQRIDARLGEVQTGVEGVQSDIVALQARMDARKARVLFVFKLLALLSSLMLAWILYTQIVVIQHHRARM